METAPAAETRAAPLEWREPAAVALLSALLLAAVFLTTDRIVPGTPNYSFGIMDHLRYIPMTQGNPLDFHLAPFCWRILMPLIVKAQPFGIETGFLLVTLISLLLSGILVYYMLKAAGFGLPYAAFGVVFFYAFGWATKQNVFNFWSPDAFSYLFTLLAIYAIYAKRDWLFIAALTVGVLGKESVFFVAPLYYSLQASRLIDWRLLRKSALMVAPAAAALAALRIGIPQRNGEREYLATFPPGIFFAPDYELVPYSLTSLFRTTGLTRLQYLSPYTVGLRYLIFPLGVAPLVLPLLALKRVALVLLRWSPFLVLVYAQLLFANNTERLIVLAFPALIVMSVTALREVMTALGLNPWLAIVLPACLFVLDLFSRDAEWAYLSTPWQIAIVALFLTLLAAVFVLRRGARRTGSALSA